MTGLILLVVAAAWLVVVGGLTWAVTSRIKHVAFRYVVALMAFATLLPLPVLDELIGKQQFEALCKQYAVQHVDEKNAMNRTVVYERRREETYAKGTTIAIRIDPRIYKDAETGEVLVSYHTLHAEGGWFIRMLGISETNAPLLLQSFCGPAQEDAFKKKFNIKVVN